MTTNDAPVLRQNVRWGEEYVSRGLNAKLAGIISPGVYHGFVLKPGGMMAVLVDHEPDYPRSVAVVERDGYSLTVVMDDPGIVRIPATGTWFVCLEALYTPTQQGYQRIVVREKPEAHHIVLGKVRAGVPLTEPGETEPGSNDEESDAPSSAPGEAVVITQEMISAGEPKVNTDNATLDDLTASIKAHDESAAAHGFDDPKSPLRKAIAAETKAAVNEKIGSKEGQINLLAHASTHAQDGVDPITPESIGAASENDPRLTSAITAQQIGTGLHMDEVGEGEVRPLLAADIASLERPGIVMPDGVTTDVDEDGVLSALGGNLPYNDAALITESGVFVSPVAGWALVLMISGGYGGLAGDGRNAWGASGGNAGVVRGLFEYLQEGQEVPVTVGAGGLGGVIGYITGDEYGGAPTIFNGHSTHDATTADGRPVAGHLARTTTNYYNASAVEQLSAVGAGINGGSATYEPYIPANLPGQHFHLEEDDGRFWGSGGGAYVHKNGFCCYGNGKQGAILVLFHNPAKAAGPAPTPALFMARAAARVATQPAVVNLYDPETGEGSVWLEEDAEAKLAEGLISQEAWQEICAAKAAEERAAWLASPDTEAERFDLLRSARDARLSATDYLVAPDYPLTDEQRAAVTAYRQALRDLPAQEGAPWDGGGELTPWPEEPAVSKVVS